MLTESVEQILHHLHFTMHREYKFVTSQQIMIQDLAQATERFCFTVCNVLTLLLSLVAIKHMGIQRCKSGREGSKGY